MNRRRNEYKHYISYAFFGVLTTVINITFYTIFYKYFLIPNVWSNILAWLVAVLFAFITNKLWVFNSKNMSPSIFLEELLKFTTARIATGIIDTLIMFISVDILHLSPLVTKVFANIIVIILNYILSSLLVFKKTV